MSRDLHKVEPDWEPVRSVLGALLEDLGDLAQTVTDFIRHTVPVYLALPEEEHRAAVEGQLMLRLCALAEARPLGAAALEASAGLAAARAAEGIPIDAVIAAYQAGDQEIWRSLAERGSPGVTSMMPEIGRMMFAATSATTEAMARAHMRVARGIDGGRITLAHQFLQLLDDPDGQAEAAGIARRLGFDPSGDFVALAWLAGGDPPGSAYEAASSLRAADLDVVIRATGHGSVEVLAQAQAADQMVAHVVDELPGGRLGVGLPRHGLAGARSSIADARTALRATTSSRPIVRFADHWLESVVLADSERLEVITRAAVEAAEAHAHLAATVEAFAAADMSIATTAQAIHLHANSVAYRLGRWRLLTGLDPRTFEGLAQSVIVCRIAQQRQ